MAPIRIVMACSLLLACGCVALPIGQDARYRYVNRKRACQAWKQCYSTEKRRCLGKDFEDGFKTGYFDTATGLDCRVPPVAPSKYWTAKYQNCEGQAAVQSWFRGYQNGIVAAQACALDQFNTVPVSPQAPVLNQTACGQCFAADPCEDCGCGPVSVGCNPCQTGHRIHPSGYPIPSESREGGFFPPMIHGEIDEQVLESTDPQPAAETSSETIEEVTAESEGVKDENSNLNQPGVSETDVEIDANLEDRSTSPGDKPELQAEPAKESPVITAPPEPINNLTTLLPLPTTRNAIHMDLQQVNFTQLPEIIGGLGGEPRYAMVGPSDVGRMLKQKENDQSSPAEQDGKPGDADKEAMQKPEEGAVKLAPAILQLPE